MKYVYLLKAGQNHYKVGVATNVNKRIAGIQTPNPIHIDIVATKLVTNAEQVESNIHKALQQMKAGGGTEWFELTPEQAVEVAILINKNPELDISEQITMSAIMRQQRWLQKMINNKLDHVINTYQKHPIIKEQKPDTDEVPAKTKKVVRDDDLMAKAIEVFQQEGKASTSLLQRKLSIGYGKAARIMDKLEEAGFISELDGAKPRVLTSMLANRIINKEREEWQVASCLAALRQPANNHQWPFTRPSSNQMQSFRFNLASNVKGSTARLRCPL